MLPWQKIQNSLSESLLVVIAPHFGEPLEDGVQRISAALRPPHGFEQVLLHVVLHPPLWHSLLEHAPLGLHVVGVVSLRSHELVAVVHSFMDASLLELVQANVCLTVVQDDGGAWEDESFHMINFCHTG